MVGSGAPRPTRDRPGHGFTLAPIRRQDYKVAGTVRKAWEHRGKESVVFRWDWKVTMVCVLMTYSGQYITDSQMRSWTLLRGAGPEFYGGVRTHQKGFGAFGLYLF